MTEAAAIEAKDRAGGPSADTTWLVEAEGLERSYTSEGGDVHALRGVDLRVRRGELVAIRGRSGSGKTTLLNLLGGLDRPTGGWVAIDGDRLDGLSEEDLAALRRRVVSYVFQSFGLLPILSAAENVGVPLRMVSTDPAERDRRVDELLGLVGLSGRADHRPAELSGGEQQRVAIARALASGPSLLLADEPSGQLDSATGRAIMTLIRDAVRSEGVTAIVTSHDPTLIDVADRVIELRDGRFV